MALYAIGDLHLHFNSELKSRMQMKERVWRDRDKKLERHCRSLRDDDVLMLLGDHSWGRNLEQAGPDLDFIAALPGRKVLTRGNHDMFWTSRNTDELNRAYAGKLTFLQNSYIPYGDYALVASKGYCFEGPFYLDGRGEIIGWDEKSAYEGKELTEREIKRLRLGFDAARADGYKKFIMFLHFPPTDILEDESDFTRLAEEQGVSQVVYAHVHGSGHFSECLKGDFHGIKYSLASGDYLKWRPLKVLD